MSSTFQNDGLLDWLAGLSDAEVCFPILPWDMEDPDWEMDYQDAQDYLAYLDLTGNRTRRYDRAL